VDRLDWPLTGEMFNVVYPGWYLRPGMLNLDIFCPACQMFPFNHDPNIAGGNAVGKALNVRGADGKPVVMTVKQILLTDYRTAFRVEPTLMPENDGRREQQGADLALPDKSAQSPGEKPAFPCPICGAKKRFHKKGCTAAAVPSNPTAEVREHAPLDPILLDIEARVSSGPDRDGQPTIDDLKDLERDRERRASGRPEPELRPGEGYVPKAV